MADVGNTKTKSNWIGAAISAGADLLGGLLGKSSTSSTNKLNYKMFQEQNEFNSKEADKARKWQEDFYQKHQTAQAQASDLRAAGLNAQLQGVQTGQAASSTSTASAGEPIAMQSQDYSFLGQGARDAVSAYNQTRSVDSQTSLNRTMETLNQSYEQLNHAKEEFERSNTEVNRMRVKEMQQNVDFLIDTFSSRVRSQYMNETLLTWRQQSEKYNAITQMYNLFNLAPAQVDNLQSSTAYNYAAKFKAIADGKLTLKDIQNYGRKLAIQQTMALGSYMSGKGSLLSGKASLESASAAQTNAATNAKYFGELQRGAKISNDFTKFQNDFWTGRADDYKTLQYIKGEPRLYQMYRINVLNNKWTLDKLMEEPKLVRSMIRANNAGAANQGTNAIRNFLETLPQPAGTVEETYTEKNRYGADGEYRGSEQTTQRKTRPNRGSGHRGRRR